MPDDIDGIVEREAEILQRRLEAATYTLPQGSPGDCALCGEWTARLVNNVCAPCRDKHNLP